MTDHLGKKAMTTAYQRQGNWYIGYFGMVAVGNDRYVFGFLKEVCCAGKSEALAVANMAQAY